MENQKLGTLECDKRGEWMLDKIGHVVATH